MSDGLYRLRPARDVHPHERAYPTLPLALSGAIWLSRMVGRVFVERDGETVGSMLVQGDGTAYRHGEE